MIDHNPSLLDSEVVVPFLLACFQLLPHDDEHLLGVDPHLRDLGGGDVFVGMDAGRVLPEGFHAIDDYGWRGFVDCCLGYYFFDELGEIFADLAQHPLVFLAALSYGLVQFINLLLPLVQLSIQLVDSRLILLQLHALLPILLFLLPDLLMQFLSGEVELLLYLIAIGRGIELCSAVASLPNLKISRFDLYFLMIDHPFCGFVLSVMEAAPLAQQPERIIEFLGDFVHLLRVLVLQPFYLSLVNPFVVGPFSQQLVVFLPDLDVEMAQLVEGLGLDLRLIRVVSLECVLLINLVDVLIILEIVSELFQFCFGVNKGRDL